MKARFLIATLALMISGVVLADAPSWGELTDKQRVVLSQFVSSYVQPMPKLPGLMHTRVPKVALSSIPTASRPSNFRSRSLFRRRLSVSRASSRRASSSSR